MGFTIFLTILFAIILAIPIILGASIYGFFFVASVKLAKSIWKDEKPKENLRIQNGNVQVKKQNCPLCNKQMKRMTHKITKAVIFVCQDNPNCKGVLNVVDVPPIYPEVEEKPPW